MTFARWKDIARDSPWLENVHAFARRALFSTKRALSRKKVAMAAAVTAAGAVIACLGFTRVTTFDVSFDVETSHVEFDLEGPADVGQSALEQVTVSGVQELTIPAALTRESVLLHPPAHTADFAFTLQRSADADPRSAVAIGEFPLDRGVRVNVSGRPRAMPEFEVAVAGSVNEALHLLMRHTVELHSPTLSVQRDVGQTLPELDAKLSDRFTVRGAFSTEQLDLLGGPVRVSSLTFALPRAPGDTRAPESAILGGTVKLPDYGGEAIRLQEGLYVSSKGSRGKLRVIAIKPGRLRAIFNGEVHRLATGFDDSSLSDRTPSLLERVQASKAFKIVILSIIAVCAAIWKGLSAWTQST